jgi:hypothetical protein
VLPTPTPPPPPFTAVSVPEQEDPPADMPEPVLPPAPSSPDVNEESSMYIRIQHHPRAQKEDETITLDGPSTASETGSNARNPSPSHADCLDFGYQRPWAPFVNRADFEVAKHIVTNRLGEQEVNSFLTGLAGGDSNNGRPHSDGYQKAYVWHSGNSHVNLKTSRDFSSVMERARAFVPKVSIYHPYIFACSNALAVGDERVYGKVSQVG